MANQPPTHEDPTRPPTEEELNQLQVATLQNHEINPANGLIRDKSDPNAPSSIARAWSPLPRRSASRSHADASRSARSRGRPVERARVEADPFVADVTRMLLTFFCVVAVDVVIVSLITQRLRFWFPSWLDPEWAIRPDPWVVYSQSYFAGIFMIPLFCRLIDRDFVATVGVGARAAFWSLCLGVFAFVLWWKGSLMLEYHKQYEALGWAALTGGTWTILRFAGVLPERVRGLTRRQMLGGLLFGVSLFLLVMSVLDPLVQLGVQRLAWSPGLAIEVGFFIPAGIALLTLSRRLRS